MHMAWDIAVVRGEELKQNKEHVDQGGIRNNGHQLLDSLLAGIKFCYPLDDQAQQDKKCGTTRKGRGQKAGGQDCGKPEMTSRQTGVKKGGYRMDTDSPGYGNIDERLDPLGRCHFLLLCVQDNPAHKDIQEEIDI